MDDSGARRFSNVVEIVESTSPLSVSTRTTVLWVQSPTHSESNPASMARQI